MIATNFLPMQLAPLQPILGLPETDNFAIVRTSTQTANGRQQVYGIACKPITKTRKTMIPSEQQQVGEDIETMVRVLFAVESKYNEWRDQNGELDA